MINFHFHKGGAVTIQPEGYPGRLCHDATRSYEEALGPVQKRQELDDTQAARQVIREQIQERLQ